MDLSALTNTDPLEGDIGPFTVETMGGLIENVLPIVGVAVLIGFLFYTIRWAIGLFRKV